MTKSPEILAVERALTRIAITRLRQAGQLNVRQGEQLRRALYKAGDQLGWAVTAATSKNPIGVIAKDVTRLIKDGSKTLKAELEAAVAFKHTEFEGLESSIEEAHALAEDPDLVYPYEFSFAHTARDASEGLITKTELVVAAEAQELTDVGNLIQKSLNKWNKLRDQMLKELEETQGLLSSVSRSLNEFVDSLSDLFHEIIAMLG